MIVFNPTIGQFVKSEKIYIDEIYDNVDISKIDPKWQMSFSSFVLSNEQSDIISFLQTEEAENVGDFLKKFSVFFSKLKEKSMLNRFTTFSHQLDRCISPLEQWQMIREYVYQLLNQKPVIVSNPLIYEKEQILRKINAEESHDSPDTETLNKLERDLDIVTNLLLSQTEYIIVNPSLPALPPWFVILSPNLQKKIVEWMEKKQKYELLVNLFIKKNKEIILQQYNQFNTAKKTQKEMYETMGFAEIFNEFQIEFIDIDMDFPVAYINFMDLLDIPSSQWQTIFSSQLLKINEMGIHGSVYEQIDSIDVYVKKDKEQRKKSKKLYLFTLEHFNSDNEEFYLGLADKLLESDSLRLLSDELEFSEKDLEERIISLLYHKVSIKNFLIFVFRTINSIYLDELTQNDRELNIYSKIISSFSMENNEKDIIQYFICAINDKEGNANTISLQELIFLQYLAKSGFPFHILDKLLKIYNVLDLNKHYEKELIEMFGTSDPEEIRKIIIDNIVELNKKFLHEVEQEELEL